MKKAVIKKMTALMFSIVLCLTFASCGRENVSTPMSTDFYLTDLPVQTQPANLLVLIFNYNNGYYEGSDTEIEKLWSDYIFGTGTLEDGSASVNDFYKEMSHGQFYFDPILLDGNTSGVYSFHLDKDYSDDQGLHPEWPFFEFNYDMMGAFESLVQKGLDLNEFAAEGIDNENYYQILTDYWDTPQWNRNPQWYSASKVLCVFPTYNTEKVDWTPLSSDADSFSLYAHINYDSSWGTIVHELAHTIGAIDVYNFGTYYSDLMSAFTEAEYGAAHIDPFYKIVFDWVAPDVIEESSTITLFPASSDQYRPAIIKTIDPGQYFIAENRAAEDFDSVLGELGCEGIHVWRIDKLGCEAIYPINSPRKGITLESILQNPGDSIKTKRYESDDIRATKEVSSAKVTYNDKNADGSIDVSIEI